MFHTIVRLVKKSLQQTLAVVLGGGIAFGAFAQDAPLIPREVLFGNPDKAGVRLSPDGKQLSYLAPVDGVMNIWVGTPESPDTAKPVTQEKERPIRSYYWAFTNQHLIYAQDKGGDENFHVFVVDLASGETRNFTPLDGVRAEISSISHRLPNEILIGTNDRNPQLHDLYRYDLGTGERELVAESQGFLGIYTDYDYRPRFAAKMTLIGGIDIVRYQGGGQWEAFDKIPFDDALTTQGLGFNKSGNVAYIMDSRGRNTAALMALDLETTELTLLAEHPRADLDSILVHPTEHTVEAVGFNYARREWTFLDERMKSHFETLGKVSGGDIQIVDRTLDDQWWIVGYLEDAGPLRYYRYNTGTREAEFLFTNQSSLEGLPLTPMHPVVIKSRDGLDLVSYLTLPPAAKGNDRPAEPVPMVLFVHGGPWARDMWGYNPYHQWLANRGYAVLSVNYRGSTGFGKDFINASIKEWAGKMHDDLIDAVNWAVAEGIADKDKVAISGGSYGGYATLVGLTFTPDVFACGVDIVGPSNLVTLLESIPPYWAPGLAMWTNRVGDHRTDEGKALLTERSPLTHVDNIKRPLLIGQGANDPRVKQQESDQIVEAMQEKNIPVTYVLYPDEGHGFARPENRFSFNAITEAFLAEHLGGRVEPIGGAFQGSSLEVPAGADQVAGLKAALGGS